ncbi:MAG: hypothetical protein COZ70_02365 [Deltaproteobacteria bacterium CG_4_8_14_3_um_filter_51_11]|nr:MAG: hypothetical protein AUK25_11475 [Desulfobacteraceae bacterium CG2_30_51_40]PIX20673.1 MAG: hypothetical protein COZ70_02365 [Deltaproteobacteria bacterium CG_4_8_14_3_um_filter_51_11]
MQSFEKLALQINEGVWNAGFQMTVFLLTLKTSTYKYLLIYSYLFVCAGEWETAMGMGIDIPLVSRRRTERSARGS